MGFVETQRARNDRLIAAASEGLLEPGEAVATSFPATKRIPWWPVALLFPVFFYFELIGTDLPPGTIGAIIAALFLVMLRSYFVVLTNRRVLVLHLRWMSSKNVDRSTATARPETTATYREGLLNGRLRLAAGTESYDLQVARPFRDRAQTAASELAPG